MFKDNLKTQLLFTGSEVKCYSLYNHCKNIMFNIIILIENSLKNISNILILIKILI